LTEIQALHDRGVIVRELVDVLGDSGTPLHAAAAGVTTEAGRRLIGPANADAGQSYTHCWQLVRTWKPPEMLVKRQSTPFWSKWRAETLQEHESTLFVVAHLKSALAFNRSTERVANVRNPAVCVRPRCAAGLIPFHIWWQIATNVKYFSGRARTDEPTIDQPKFETQ
jgi:hypothetical protein